MNKLLTLVGLIAVLALGCDTAPPSPTVSSAGASNSTTMASISPENKATAIYSVTGMT